MKQTIRRIRRLEALSLLAGCGKPQETLRVVLGYDAGPTRLETSTCHRRIDRTGLLIELVELDGTSEDLIDGTSISSSQPFRWR
jgi:hypothetical protein